MRNMRNCNQNFFKVIFCFLILIQIIFGINYLMGSNLVLLLQFLLAINWAYTEINVGGEQNMRNIFFLPPP